MMKKYIYSTIVILLINFTYCSAQTKSFQYSPKSNDSLISYIKAINEVKKLKLGIKYKKEIKEIINDRTDNFIENIKDSTYIFDQRISNYLNKIVCEISKANGSIKTKDFYFFIDKSPIPNAACYGNGIYTVNLGLFNLIQNDDQLAFILCHEIGHYVLEHNDKNILKSLETSNSKETKAKISKLKNQEYGSRKAFSELVKNSEYNFSKRSREAEIQADSLGLVIFSKTKYKKSESLKSLKILDFPNDMIFNVNVNLKKHFDFENYPFKDFWMSKDDILFDLKKSANDYEFDIDSLKTHPDIPIRIKLLEKIVQNDNSISKESDELRNIKKIASENSIITLIDDSRIDFALYQTLLLFDQNQIDEKEYCNKVSFLLKKTYELKNNHTFGKYIGLVNQFSDEKNLNDIKIFLNNIEIKEVRKIGLQFCLKHQSITENNPEFIETTEFFKILNQ